MKDIKSTQAENVLSKVSTNTRRQFFKKAAIGSALLTTVSSRPVWATAVGCTVSGQMSGNLSNPDWDECDGTATGKSPGWWKKWAFIYDLFLYNPGVTWTKIINGELPKKYKNSDSLFKLNDGGSAITVLYNWIVASENSGDPKRISYPAINGAITPLGEVLYGSGNDPDYNYAAALLSTAHPDIKFPYPDNPWTLDYLIANYADPTTNT